MKLAIIGSRGLNINIGEKLPEKYRKPDMIISGGARGIDTLARQYAEKNGIELEEIKPDYEQYGKYAPHIRNNEIIKKADVVIAFWDGKSRGTSSVIKKCRKIGKEIEVIECFKIAK